MAISQASGNAGLNPGIYTSSTRPASPADGLVISETDTDSLQIYKGSAWGPASGVVLLETLSPSAAATTQFTTGSFSSTYKFYTVKYVLNTSFSFQLRSAGSTITAANYVRAIGQNSTGNVFSGGYAPGETSVRIMTSNGTPAAYEGSFDCFDPSVSKVQSFAPMNSLNQFSGSTQGINFGLFLYNSAQVYDSLLFTATTGTLTGTIKLYGWS